ncbi:hypothetical protein HDE77_000302 [Rhodanobacter sp. MP7CTX1]|nr:hypothetical protein [Rhodanobacter sp. MP7CTX1]
MKKALDGCVSGIRIDDDALLVSVMAYFTLHIT